MTGSESGPPAQAGGEVTMELGSPRTGMKSALSPIQAHPKGRQVHSEAIGRVRALVGDGPLRRDLLIEYLHVIQDKHGHLPEALLAALADRMGLAQAEVYEVATFYAHFDVIKDGQAAPPPLTVRVCGGIACEMAGARNLLEALLKDLPDVPGDKVRVIPAPCVGACHRAPVAVAGRRQIGHATSDTVMAAIGGGQTEPPLPAATELAAYVSGGGYEVLKTCLDGGRSREAVTGIVGQAGLLGLGGAGFPAARKWGFLNGTPKPRLVVINADEGEPGTFKDRHCLKTDPHRVLEGALIAAWAVEAEAVYIYLRDEYPELHTLLRREIAAAGKAGVTGGVEFHLRRGAGAYICGEESALLESIEGKRGLPRIRPPYPAQVGLFGRPTLINNVETVFWLREIIEKGAEWYIGAGRPHFYSVSGRVRQPGVKLAPAGVTVNQLIDEYSGGMAEGHTFAAYLPGGASGGILPADKGGLPLDFGELEEYGCFIGSSAVVVLSDQDDIKSAARNLVRFFEEESCGQCTPCRVGCEKMLGLMAQPVWDKDLITELSDAMRDASICGLGQAAPNPVLSLIRFFGDRLQ